MALPALIGPHTLSVSIVDQVSRSKVAGVYVLSARVGGDINVRRVVRSDDDLASALKEFVGLYSHFSCASATSPRNAYEMECELFHAEKPPENTSHPVRPLGADWTCPTCGQ